eukprot:4355199-Pleurochrysis_carterae.AAC.4
MVLLDGWCSPLVVGERRVALGPASYSRYPAIIYSMVWYGNNSSSEDVSLRVPEAPIAGV